MGSRTTFSLFSWNVNRPKAMARAASTDALDGIETAFRSSEPRELAQGFEAPWKALAIGQSAARSCLGLTSGNRFLP